MALMAHFILAGFKPVGNLHVLSWPLLSTGPTCVWSVHGLPVINYHCSFASYATAVLSTAVASRVASRVMVLSLLRVVMPSQHTTQQHVRLTVRGCSPCYPLMLKLDSSCRLHVRMNGIAWQAASMRLACYALRCHHDRTTLSRTPIRMAATFFKLQLEALHCLVRELSGHSA